MCSELQEQLDALDVSKRLLKNEIASLWAGLSSAVADKERAEVALAAQLKSLRAKNGANPLSERWLMSQ